MDILSFIFVGLALIIVVAILHMLYIEFIYRNLDQEVWECLSWDDWKTPEQVKQELLKMYSCRGFGHKISEHDVKEMLIFLEHLQDVAESRGMLSDDLALTNPDKLPLGIFLASLVPSSREYRRTALYNKRSRWRMKIPKFLRPKPLPASLPA